MTEPKPPTDSGVALLDLPAIGSRVRQLLTEAELDGTAFAASVGVPYGTMRAYVSGARAPSPEFLAGCYRAFGFMPGWLLTGLGPARWEQGRAVGVTADSQAVMATAYIADESPAAWRLPAVQGKPPSNLHAPPKRGLQPHGTAAPAGALLPHSGDRPVRPLVLSLPAGRRGEREQQRIEYLVIPRHMKPAAAGHGNGGATDADVVDLAGDMAFSFDWLRRNFGNTLGSISSIQVRGDSNAPTLLDGDTIVIDEGVQTIDADGFYVLEVFGRRLVKRVQHLHDGTLILISDNPAYQRETLARDIARNVVVIGRMIWPRVR